MVLKTDPLVTFIVLPGKGKIARRRHAAYKRTVRTLEYSYYIFRPGHRIGRGLRIWPNSIPLAYNGIKVFLPAQWELLPQRRMWL